MSIYATLAEIGIKRFGDKSFVNILIQGVPPHIDYVGPGWKCRPHPPYYRRITAIHQEIG
jgi:hypothetical protein